MQDLNNFDLRETRLVLFPDARNYLIFPPERDGHSVVFTKLIVSIPYKKNRNKNKTKKKIINTAG